MANNKEMAAAARTFMSQFRLLYEYSKVVEEIGNFDEKRDQFIRENKQLKDEGEALNKEIQELNGMVSDLKASIAELTNKSNGIAATASVEAKEIVALAKKQAKELITKAEQSVRESESAHNADKEKMNQELVSLKGDIKSLTSEKNSLEHAIDNLKKKFA